MKRAWPVIAAALLVVTACASDPGYTTVGSGGFGQGGGGDEASYSHGLPNTFISPAGKPYRANADAAYPMGIWFAEADKNHDGRLTLEEFRADAATFFDELDANHDGVIDGFEVQTYEQKIAPEILPLIEGLGSGEGMNLALGKRGGNGSAQIGASRGSRDSRERAGDLRPQGAGLFGLLNEPEPVSAADANFDGKITKAEFLAAADRRFAALDTSNSGALTLASLPKTPVQQALDVAKLRRARPDRR